MRTVAEITAEPAWHAYRAWLRFWADAWGPQSAREQAGLLLRYLARQPCQ